MRIRGIDPGLQRTGFGLIEVPDADPGGPASLVDAGVFRLQPKDPVISRLVHLESDLAEFLRDARPDVAGVEALFAHYAHPRTAITMAHARGVILLTLRKAGLEVFELPPNEVKKSVTGHGHASKHQIQHAVAGVLGLAEVPEPPDIADALAIALCAAGRVAAGRLTIRES